MRERLEMAVDAEAHNRKNIIAALKFSALLEQWDKGEKERRAKRFRPALVIDLTNKFVRQITGDIRQNGGSIHVRPVDADGTAEVAKIREGKIRQIEYKSRAQTIYSAAADALVRSGYAAWRILTRYRSEDTFEQEIYIAPVKNALAAFIDPHCRELDRSDADWGFVLEWLSKEEFERRWPNAEVPTDSNFPAGTGVNTTLWFDKDAVTVAEYFERKATTREIALLSDGSVVDKGDAERAIATAGQGEQVGGAEPPATILKTRKAETYKVKHYVCTAAEVLEEEDWPGKYIPIVTAWGETINVEGKDYVYGLIFRAMDSQKLFNYCETNLYEVMSLAPKQQWQMTAKQLENYERDYTEGNVENLPVALYNPEVLPGGQMVPMPQRINPAPMPGALFAAIEQAEKNIENTIGMFKASVGAPSNEASGVAIKDRQRESDVGTFVFIDSLAQAREFTGRIINDLLPHYYDTARDVTLQSVDGKQSVVPINTTVGAATKALQADPMRYSGVDPQQLQAHLKTKGPDAPYNQLDQGKYEVSLTIGPAYTTQRQEAQDRLLQLAPMLAKMPPQHAYHVIKAQDFLGADEWAEMVKKMLPPGLIPLKSGELPPQPMPPPPQMVLAQKKIETEGLKAQVQILKLQAEAAKAGKEKVKDEGKIRQIVLSVLNEVHGQLAGGQP